nr:hypothetical protein [Tanacetum cinerariifolium]
MAVGSGRMEVTALGAWVFVGVSSGVMGKGVDSGGMAVGSGRMEVTGWREIWDEQYFQIVGKNRGTTWICLPKEVVQLMKFQQ